MTALVVIVICVVVVAALALALFHIENYDVKVLTERERIDSDALKARGVLPGIYHGDDHAPETWLCPNGCCRYEPPDGQPTALNVAFGWHTPGADPLCPFDLLTMVRDTAETRAAYEARRVERWGTRVRNGKQGK